MEQVTRSKNVGIVIVFVVVVIFLVVLASSIFFAIRFFRLPRAIVDRSNAPSHTELHLEIFAVSEIPDDVAYDILFRLFARPETNESDKEKKIAYGQIASFNQSEMDLVRTVANDYQSKVQPVDQRISDLKEARSEVLNELKNQKRIAIQNAIADLKERARTNNIGEEKVSRFVSEYVQKRIRGFGARLPEKTVVPYCGGYVYFFSDALYVPAGNRVWAVGQLSPEPNSCGHSYRLRFNLNGPEPGGSYQSGTTELSASLIDAKGAPIEGRFSSEVTVEASCPQAQDFKLGGKIEQTNVRRQ